MAAVPAARKRRARALRPRRGRRPPSRRALPRDNSISGTDTHTRAPLPHTVVREGLVAPKDEPPHTLNDVEQRRAVLWAWRAPPRSRHTSRININTIIIITITITWTRTRWKAVWRRSQAERAHRTVNYHRRRATAPPGRDVASPGTCPPVRVTCLRRRRRQSDERRVTTTNRHGGCGTWAGAVRGVRGCWSPTRTQHITRLITQRTTHHYCWTSIRCPSAARGSTHSAVWGGIPMDRIPTATIRRGRRWAVCTRGCSTTEASRRLLRHADPSHRHRIRTHTTSPTRRELRAGG